MADSNARREAVAPAAAKKPTPLAAAPPAGPKGNASAPKAAVGSTTTPARTKDVPAKAVRPAAASSADAAAAVLEGRISLDGGGAPPKKTGRGAMGGDSGERGAIARFFLGEEGDDNRLPLVVTSITLVVVLGGLLWMVSRDWALTKALLTSPLKTLFGI